MSSGSPSPDREGTQAAERELTEWFLLDGSRSLVAAATATVLLAFITSVSVSGLSPLRDVQPFFYVFVGLITGTSRLSPSRCPSVSCCSRRS